MYYVCMCQLICKLIFSLADITAEQLFNMFFNGAFPTRQGPMTNPYYPRSFARRWPPESDNDNHHQQQVILFI